MCIESSSVMQNLSNQRIIYCGIKAVIFVQNTKSYIEFKKELNSSRVAYFTDKIKK